MMGIDVRNTHIGKMQYVDTYTAPAASTHLRVDGLDLSTVSAYFFIAKWQCGAAGTNNISFYIQTGGSTWEEAAADYYNQQFNMNGAAVTAVRSNSSCVMYTGANNYAQCYGWLVADQDGKPRFYVFGNRDDPAGIRLYNGWVIRNNTTNATGLELHGSRASHFLTGATLEVWKVIK